MIIGCIKGFLLDGGSLPIMQGEEFKLIDRDEMIFESVDGVSMNPGMEFQFTNELLANNFRLLVGA
jgi:hypothetical protein